MQQFDENIQDEGFIYFLHTIKGNFTSIITPFGQKLLLPLNWASQGRALNTIEDIIQKTVKPVLNNNEGDNDFSSEYKQQIYSYSVNSILNSLKAPQDHYSLIPCGLNIMQVYSKLSKVLRLNEIVKNIQSQQKDPKQKIDETKLPVVFISRAEPLSNHLSWNLAGCKIVSFHVNKKGIIDVEELKKKLESHKNHKIQIISLTACSVITGQVQDLIKIDMFISSYRKSLGQDVKLTYVLDGSQYSVYNRIDLQLLKEVDYLCLEPSRILGGNESCGIILAKKQVLQLTDSIDYASKGIKVIELKDKSKINIYENDPFSHDDNAFNMHVQLYRAALTFEHQDLIGLKDINEKLFNTSVLFREQFQNLNEQLSQKKGIIDLIDYDSQGVFSINIQEIGNELDASGKKFVHPNLIAKVLSDFYGIQAIPVSNCETVSGANIYGVTNPEFDKLVKIAKGYTLYKPSHLRIEPFYHSDLVELNYLFAALQLITMHETDLIRIYNKTKDHTFELLNYQPLFHFSIQNMKDFEPVIAPYMERDQIYQKQLEISTDYYYNTKKYLQKQQKALAIEEQQQFLDPQEIILQHDVLVGIPFIDPPQYKENFNNSVYSQALANPLSNSYIDQNQQFSMNLEKLESYTKVDEQLQQNDKAQQQNLSKHKNDIQLTKGIPTQTDANEASIHQQSDNSKLQPSQLFNNILHSLGLRQKHLKEIFEYYSQREDFEFMMPVNNFLVFATDFNFNGSLLSQHEIINLVAKQCIPSKGLTFFQFQQSLEEIAKTVYKKNDNLITVYDKTQQFLMNVIGLDDPEKYRKMLIDKKQQHEIQEHKKEIQQQLNLQIEKERSMVQENQQRFKQQGVMLNYYELKWDYKRQQGYSFKHKFDGMRRLQLRDQVEWQSLQKITASDWNSALREKKFKPTDLFDIHEQDQYLKQYDIGIDIRQKKILDQQKQKMQEQYGNYKEKLRPTQKSMIDLQAMKQKDLVLDNNQQHKIINQQLEQLGKNNNLGNNERVKQMQLLEQQKQKDLLKFLNSPPNQRQRMF